MARHVALFLFVVSSLSVVGADTPRTVVVWISVDGLRADYAERYDAPFLKRLMREGAFTKRCAPPFPSLTFPSHVSQVTGVSVERHGIPGNHFYDAVLGEEFSFPDGSDLLEAEPIWITATRQGVRSAVAMWPMSYAQTGPIKSAYFAQSYPQDWSDERRLMEVVRIWEEDRDAKPLQLLIGYMPGLDTAGHRFGPESRQTGEAVRNADALLARFFGRVNEVFERKMRAEDHLYLLITTDHGMSACHTYLNVEKLAGDALPKGAKVVLTSTLAHVFFDRGAGEAVRAGEMKRLQQALSRHAFLRVCRREDLPERWGARHPTRVGDLVVIAKVGYAMSSRGTAGVVPVARLPGLNVGVHGYPAEESPEMHGLSVLWRSKTPLGGVDLGEISNLQWHATVAGLLGIRPAEGAAEGIRLK